MCVHTPNFLDNLKGLGHAICLMLHDKQMSTFSTLALLLVLGGGLLLINAYADTLGTSGSLAAGVVVGLIALCVFAYGIYWLLNTELPNSGLDHEVLRVQFNKELRLQRSISRAIERAETHVKRSGLTCEDYATLFPQDCNGPDAPIVKEGLCAWNPEKVKCEKPSAVVAEAPPSVEVDGSVADEVTGGLMRRRRLY